MNESDDTLDGGGEAAQSGEDNPNREAANYRRRLRDTEAERDDLAGQLATARENLIAARVGDRVRPEVFVKLTDHPLEAFFDDDGTVNDETLDDALGDVLDLLGHPQPPAPRAQGDDDGPDIGTVLHQGLTDAAQRTSVHDLFQME